MRTLLLALTVTLSASAGAVCLAVVGGTVWTPAGPVDGQTVFIDGERIVAGPIAGCREIDARGRVVTAGFVDAWTDLGINEIDLEASAVDAVPTGLKSPQPMGVFASFRVADAYNPRATAIPVTRIAGITSVVTVPWGGLVSGQAAWADLAGGSQAETVRKPSAAMAATVVGTGASHATALASLRRLLLEAREYAQRREAWERNQARPWLVSHVELEALLPVLRGDLPLALHVERASDIEAALRLRAELALRLVVVGGAEAWLVAPALAAARVPVIVDPYVMGAGTFDQVRGRPDNAALLDAAGVPVIISAFWGHNARTLGQVAGNAVRAGLPMAAAIRAVTSAPAEAFGMPDHGRLAPGALANVVVWSGDPLEVTTHAEQVIVRGAVIAPVSRQTLLRDRYLRGDGVPPALDLP